MLTRFEYFLTAYISSTSLCFGLPVSTNLSHVPLESEKVEIKQNIKSYDYPEIKATAKTTLKRKGNQLKSTQTVTWNGTPSGLVFFEWIPPKNTACSKTSFPIKKYDVNYNLTHTDRSILGSDQKPCRGLWKAEVITKSEKVISSSALLVS